MSADHQEFKVSGMAYAVIRGEAHWRPYEMGHWRPADWQYAPAIRFAVESESRANEYHETTMKQAKRIADLENAVVEAGRQIKNVVEDCYKPGVLHCAACSRSLTAAREILASACPSGGGPGHPRDWCQDYTKGVTP